MDDRHKTLSLVGVVLALTASSLFLFLWGKNHNWATAMTVSGEGSPHYVTISWTPSITNVVGYNVYVANVSGGPYKLLTRVVVHGSTYTDKAVSPGKTYFYIVKSVDSNGVESVPSKEIPATIPKE